MIDRKSRGRTLAGDDRTDNRGDTGGSSLAKFLGEIEPDIARLEVVRVELEREGYGPGQRPLWGFVFFHACEKWPSHVWKWPGDFDQLRARAAEILERATIHQAVIHRSRRTRKRVGPEKEELSRRLARAVEILNGFLTPG